MTKPPQLDMGYPLAWPDQRPRSTDRRSALFRDAGRPMTLTTSRKRLVHQIDLMTRPGRPYRVVDQLLTTNIRFTASGARDQNISRRDPADPGVAFYFTLDGRPHVLACDAWDTVYDNIAAIAAHIEALRGQERWGVGDLRQAFAGHLRLPSAPHWSSVLSVDRAAPIADIERAYRLRARDTHPDAGGTREAWDELVRAINEARREKGA